MNKRDCFLIFSRYIYIDDQDSVFQQLFQLVENFDSKKTKIRVVYKSLLLCINFEVSYNSCFIILTILKFKTKKLYL